MTSRQANNSGFVAVKVEEAKKPKGEAVNLLALEPIL
jgi:hypothetical protein